MGSKQPIASTARTTGRTGFKMEKFYIFYGSVRVLETDDESAAIDCFDRYAASAANTGELVTVYVDSGDGLNWEASNR